MLGGTNDLGQRPTRGAMRAKVSHREDHNVSFARYRPIMVALISIAVSVLACSSKEASPPAGAASASSPAEPANESEPLTYHCRHCGTALFRADAVVERRKLWELTEYSPDVLLVKEAIDLEGLRRYDVSGHEGYYCCQFALMRMLHDKFGTGENLIAYAESLVAAPAGQAPPTEKRKTIVPRLHERDFDEVMAAQAKRDRLTVVKLTALWCPPCRMLDEGLRVLMSKGRFEPLQADVFEIDVDEDPELAARFDTMGIPYTKFYYRGRPIAVTGEGLDIRDGGLTGALPSDSIETVFTRVLADARAGNTTSNLTATQK